MEEHVIFLNQVCRLGGERLPKMKSGNTVRPIYLANDFQEEINSTFKVDISCDIKEIHPPYICIKCHHAAVRGATQHKHTLSGGGCGNGQVTWEAHRRSSCDSCSKMALKKKAVVHASKKRPHSVAMQHHGKTQYPHNAPNRQHTHQHHSRHHVEWILMKK